MRRASVAGRLDCLSGRRRASDRERLVRDVAAETGLGESEVRGELAAIEDHARRYGPPTLEQFVRRCAEELGLAEADVWDEYARIVGTAGARP